MYCLRTPLIALTVHMSNGLGEMLVKLRRGRADMTAMGVRTRQNTIVSDGPLGWALGGDAHVVALLTWHAWVAPLPYFRERLGIRTRPTKKLGRRLTAYCFHRVIMVSLSSPLARHIIVAV